MNKDPIVIVSIARTPIGNLLGTLKEFTSPQLGQHVIQATLQRSTVSATAINEIIMGCVLPAGLGQAPARQASLNAGVPDYVPCTTVNKVCGSGMKAIMLAHDILQTGNAEIVIAGGMESMTNAPYLLKKARQGYRFGHSQIYDHMTLDGLEDAYGGEAMGHYADACAETYHITRKTQDDFALSSFEKARLATQNGSFKMEIVPLIAHGKNGNVIIDQDEHPFSVNPEKIPQLKAAFRKDGSITAGNASSIADGAAAVTLMRLSHANKLGIKPIAKIIAYQSSARAPHEFPIAPIDAVRNLMEKLAWKVKDIDLFEINEAFAVVVLALMQTLAIPSEKINIHGGACALGHPIGASGTRILVTLIAALQQNNLKRGIASLCIGGGEATAMAIEMIE